MATTVQQIYDVFCDRVLESGGLQLGVISADQFLAYFADVLIGFLRDTGCSKLFSTQTAVPGIGSYVYPDRLMDAECVFTSGRFIPRSDLESIDSSSYQWRGRTGQPKRWYEDGLPVKTVAMEPAPDWQGTPYSGYKFIDGTDPGSYTGTVNVYGSIVVWISGAQFRSEDSNWVGLRIDLNGTLYSISSVPSGVTLILGASAGSLTGAAYSVTYPIVIPAAERNLTVYGSQIPKGTQVRNCETTTETVSVTAQSLIFGGIVTSDADGYPLEYFAVSGDSATATVPVSPVGDNRCDMSRRVGNPQFHFHRNGTHYAIMVPDRAGVLVCVVKSTDGDQTWTRLDIANEPAAGPTFAAAWDGADSVWALHATSAATAPYTLTLRRFNLPTETWQTDSGGTFTTYSMERASMVFLTTGAIRVFFTSMDTAVGGDPTYLRFRDNNGTAWSAPVNLATLASGANTYAILQPRSFLDDSVINVVHLWYERSVEHRGHYLRVAADGTTSSPFVTTDNLGTGTYVVYGWGLTDSTTNSFVKPFTEFTGGLSKPFVLRGTPLEAPVWTKEYVNAPGNTDNWHLGADQQYLFRGSDGDQFSVFSGTDPAGPPTHATAFYISRYSGGVWSPSRILYSTVSNPFPFANLTNFPLSLFPYWLEWYTTTTTVTFTTCVDEPVRRTWHLSDVVPLIPDSACLYVGFGILAKALTDNSELKDQQKALYATSRYQEGVGLFRALMIEEIEDQQE